MCAYVCVLVCVCVSHDGDKLATVLTVTYGTERRKVCVLLLLVSV